MFRNIPKPIPATEELRGPSQSEEETPITGSAPAAPATAEPPPLRFGAKKIVLPADGNPVISITEIPKPGQAASDYVVYLMRAIPPEGAYCAELITLLNTLTADSSVVINIGSPGGSLNVGAMIANAVRCSKARVRTHVIGVVASAAALIWSYGQERTIADGGVVMIHMSSHGDWGNSEAIRLRADALVRYVKEVAIDPLVAQGLITPDEAEHIIDQRRDLWLDSATIKARLEAAHVQA